MTIKQAAEYARVGYATLCLAKQKGRLHCVREGKRWYTTKAAVDQYRLNRHDSSTFTYRGQRPFCLEAGRLTVHQASKIMAELLHRPFTAAQLYLIIKRGELPSHKWGKRIVLEAEAIMAWVTKWKATQERQQRLLS